MQQSCMFHNMSKIIFSLDFSRAVIVKAEMVCFIYSSYKCYHQRGTMKKDIWAQYVLSDSQSLIPEWFLSLFLFLSHWSYISVSLCIIYIRSCNSQTDIPTVMDVILGSAFVWLYMLNNKVIFLTWLSCVLSWHYCNMSHPLANWIRCTHYFSHCMPEYLTQGT